MDTAMSDGRKLVVLLVVLLPLLLVGCSLALESGESDAPQYRGTDPLGETANDSDGSLQGDDDDDAASDDDDVGGDDDDAPTGGGVGGAAVVALDPAPDSSDHHYRRPVTVTFDGDGSSALFTLVGPGEQGTQQELPLLPAQWAEGGTEATIYPSAFLRPSSDYFVSIEQNDSVLEYSFSTSSIGTPLDAAVGLEGMTYSIVPSQAAVVAQAALAHLLAGMSPSFVWQWQFHSVQGHSELSVETGAAVLDVGVADTDWCTPTSSLLPQGAALTLDEAYFSGAVDSASFWLGDARIELEQVEVDGDFTADASSIEEVQLQGWLDSSGLASLLPLDSSLSGAPPTPCEWIQQRLEASCESCPSGVGECVWVHVESLSGVAQSQPLEPVDLNDSAHCDGDDAFASSVSCAMSGAEVRPGLVWLLPPIVLLLRRRS